MKKQKTLFDSVEPRTKKKKKIEKVPTKRIENGAEDEQSNSKIIEEEKIEKKIKQIPKNELFICECGLKIHWKIADARKECPQCNKKIDPKEIFDYISD